MDPKADRDTARGGRLRDVRGRGRRGPLALPGPLTPSGVPATQTPAEAFDDTVVAVVERIRTRFPDEVARVDFGVEDHPLLPEDWDQRVPFATCVPASADHPARIVLFRLPLTARARGRAELGLLVLDTVVEQLAALWGRDPDDIDPPA
ncbi:MAG: metallopeptidase family protein [Nocardioidaceae bacterium]